MSEERGRPIDEQAVIGELARPTEDGKRTRILRGEGKPQCRSDGPPYPTAGSDVTAAVASIEERPPKRLCSRSTARRGLRASELILALSAIRRAIGESAGSGSLVWELRITLARANGARVRSRPGIRWSPRRSEITRRRASKRQDSHCRVCEPFTRSNDASVRALSRRQIVGLRRTETDR